MLSGIEWITHILAKQEEITPKRAEQIAEELIHVLYDAGYYIKATKFTEEKVHD